MFTTALTVLIVEDEAKIRRFVKLALEAEHLQVFEADSVARGLIEAGTRQPDLVVLDLGLPDGDGIELIRELRSWSEIPIIVLSARTAEADKVSALDAGADDYLIKPFGAAELLARVRAQLRRRTRAGTSANTVFAFGDVRVDLARRIVEKQGQQVHLTPIEFRLLACLIANAGRVMTYRQLVREVWGPTFGEQAHYARVCMQHLRQKLEGDPARPVFLLTEVGVGYRLVLS